MRILVGESTVTAMTETKYTKILPEGMFTATVERTAKHDSMALTVYDLGLKVELRPTANDFIDLFAALVRSRGRLPAASYAAMMGVETRQLESALMALTGARFPEWMDAFSGAVAEALLRGTEWEVSRIARAAGFSSSGVFCRWFAKNTGAHPASGDAKGERR